MTSRDQASSEIVLDNEKMIDYIVSVNRLFENIEIIDSYEK